MNEVRDSAGRGSYGVDSPYLLVVPLLLVVFGVMQGVLTKSSWPIVGVAAVVLLSGLDLHASCRGKFVVWSRLLDDLHLAGDKQVLDLGCGRGAVLIIAAHRLTTGMAVGVDLWRKSDQSGNDRSVTERNATVEGVTNRVELETANMVDLPFDDNVFDVVVSNLAVHNVKGKTCRDKVIDEASRVLRPGGRVLSGAGPSGAAHDTKRRRTPSSRRRLRASDRRSRDASSGLGEWVVERSELAGSGAVGTERAGFTGGPVASADVLAVSA